MTPKERAVMQQALEALEVSTDWDVGAKGKQLQSMKAITALRKALAEQAEQEPVALIEECRDALAQELMAYDIDPPIHHVKQAHDKCVAWLSNYASPVRTKDLTDDELRQVLDRNCGDGLMAIARAVIAADREKNRA